MTRPKLSRRAVLRGSGLLGLAVALPPLEIMFDGRGLLRGTATAAAATPPKNFVVFHWLYGLPGSHNWHQCESPTKQAGLFYPTAVGPVSETPELLAPLLEGGKHGNFRGDINWVSGLTMRPFEAFHIGSHGHAAMVFTCHGIAPKKDAGGNDLVNTVASLGPSVDWLGAKAVGGGDPLAIKLLPRLGDTWDQWSWQASQVPHSQVFQRPEQLWDAIFFNASMDPTAKLKYQASEQSILDFVKRDADRLRARLGAEDLARLEQHMDTIRQLEQSTQAVAPTAGCTLPARPGDGYSFLDAKGDWTGTYPADFDAYVDTMIRLGALAVRCDLRRTLMFSMGDSSNDGGHLEHIPGGSPYSIHQCQHGTDDQGSIAPRDPAWDQYKRIVSWEMEKLALLLSELKQGDGGAGGSVLSNSAFVAASEFSYGGEHGSNFLPVLVAGQAMPMPAGRHIGYPNRYKSSDGLACGVDGNLGNTQPVWEAPYWSTILPGKENRCMSDLWEAALHAVGSTEKVGDQSIYPSTPLEGLWGS